MTFGNIYLKQNANSQVHVDVLTVFHFIYCPLFLISQRDALTLQQPQNQQLSVLSVALCYHPLH